MSRSIELISEIIVDSFKGVMKSHLPESFECVHRRILPTDNTNADSKVVLVEFDGPELRRFMQLFLMEELVDPLILYDAGELLNQVAGRLSNRLYDYGFDIKNTTPRIVRSGNLDYQKFIDDSEMFYTSDASEEFSIKTVIGPVKILEQIEERGRKRRPAALKEGSMLLFDTNK